MICAAIDWAETIDLLLGLVPVLIVLGIMLLFLSIFGLGKKN